VNDPLTTLHARIDRLNYWHEILTKFEYSPSGELLIAFQQAVRDMVNEDILHSQWINELSLDQLDRSASEERFVIRSPLSRSRYITS